jgi:hypothetical protein
MNWLCNHINTIIMSTNLAYLQFTLCKNVANIMVLDISVFCSRMKPLIFSKVYDTFTVTKQVNAKFISAKLSIQTFQPNKHFAYFINSHVFCLGCRLGINKLQCCLPTHNTSIKNEHITVRDLLLFKSTAKSESI